MGEDVDIKRKWYPFKKFPTIDELIDQGYDITFEAGEHTEDDEGNEARWYCDLYYGDSNSPWKPGTRQGIGYGMTQEEAYKKAVLSMEEVI